MSFHDSTRFIFKFLLKLAHMSLLKVFMQYLSFLDFLYEQWSQIGVGIEKIGRIQTCQLFGSADGPRVRGGQSAVNWTYSPEVLQRSCQPQKFIADSPPKDRGRSAHVWAEAVSVSCSVKISKADGPPKDSGQSATGQNRGVGQTWLILDVPFTSPPNQTLLQKCLSLSLSSTWGRRQGQALLEWFPDGPSTSPDSSQDSASCPRGISMNP